MIFSADIESAWAGVRRSRSFRHVLGSHMWTGANPERLELLGQPRGPSPWRWAVVLILAAFVIGMLGGGR